MEKLGTYRVMEFRAVCRLSNIHATSTECAALRAKFKRVFAGTGTKREATHVLALLKRVREAAKAAHAQLFACSTSGGVEPSSTSADARPASSATSIAVGLVPTMVFDEPSGAACTPGVSPCGLSAGGPPVVVSIGPVSPCGCI